MCHCEIHLYHFVSLVSRLVGSSSTCPAMCTSKLPVGNMYFTMIISMIEPPPWKKCSHWGSSSHVYGWKWKMCELWNHQPVYMALSPEKKNKISPCFRQTSPFFLPEKTSRSDLLPARGWDRHLCHSQTWCRVFHPVLATWSQHFLLVVSCEAINLRCTPSI